MKRILITLAVALLSLTAAEAKEKTQTYEFGDITDIEVAWTYQVFVTKGNSNKVTVIYEDDLEESIKLDISYLPSGKPQLRPLLRLCCSSQHLSLEETERQHGI